MSNFNLVKLDDLVQRVKVGFVGQINDFYCDKEDGVPLIRTTDLNESGIDYSNLKYVTKEFHKKNKKSQIKKGDVLIARHGDNGKASVFREDFDAQVLNAVIIEPNQDLLDSELIKIFFETPFVRKQILGAVKGSVQGVINTSHVANLLIPLNQEINYQQVSKLISSLDRKIELNAHINAELESMAKTLYDYWFVQFAPHKSTGGKMVWNEELKREIPLGWEVKKLGDVLKIVRGASPRPIDDFLSTEGMPWIKISDATATDNRFITQTKQFIIEEGISKSRLLQPDTLILSNSASPGIPRITKIESCVHDGWLIIDEYTHGLTKEFMYHYFEYERPRIINLGSGSIFKNLKTEYIKGLNFLLPPVSVLEMITTEFKTISENIYIKTRESQTLTELRDWLLPMLMNGQVTVG